MSTDTLSTQEAASGPRSSTSFFPINSNRANNTNGSEVEGPSSRHNPQETTSTTPRPSTAPNTQPRPMHGTEDATTPTTTTFGAASSALANQRPLPRPFDIAASVSESVRDMTSTLNRNNSIMSNNSGGSEDVDMDDSDVESSNGDGSRPNKKKKTQRFFCVDFPPCNLSFTRSEHLARHIRKHTGERPFECHCKRRFSRLDNLRQHAQTVHQNEPIPQDSLAATGTRYPRQARNDRVRPAGNRPRAATASGQAPTHRGHHRNSYSTSSINSNASSYSQSNSFRPRPPPLQMASYGPDSPSAWRPSSPGEYSTPTSATFSTGQNSPRWASNVQSPLIGAYSRTASIYDGHRTPGRRLSTPSAAHPFSSPSLAPHPFDTPPTFTAPTPYSPGMISSPTTSTAGMGQLGGQSMATNHPDMDNRRRTWHQGTDAATLAYTSRLQNVMTPNHYANGPIPEPPTILRSNAPPAEHTKLPGISSLFPTRGEYSPPHRVISQMMTDRPNSYHQPSPTMADLSSRLHPRHSMVESTFYSQPRPVPVRDRPLSSHLDRQFTQLDLHGAPQGDAASWASDTARAVHATAEQSQADRTRRMLEECSDIHSGLEPSQANQPRVMFEHSTLGPRPGPSSSYHQHTASAPVTMLRSDRRDGWYHGPGVYHQTHDNRFQGTSPEGSSSSEGAAPVTPQSANTTDYNHTVVRSNGYPEEASRPIRPQQPIIHHYHTQSNGSEPSYTYGPSSSTQTMYQQIPKSSEQPYRTALDTLVAVATGDQITVQKPF
ncbi:hypothetical protein OCU04_007862 [Sclerotinia nivalis]|uniref:C2H2-type domain-containing protein n=1 Tax=Sclerotinia nivalis TaxID=352851 RepID=A0A9X0DHS6_9HELO|nr:hypothetical protein OCU04_007862 [Sclerotinia nivalis]